MSLLEVKSLSKVFITGIFDPNYVHALNNVNFSMQEGEVLFITGPNGSGKTTLVKTIATLITPTEGDVLVCGHNVVRESSRVRDHISMVNCEDRSFFWRMNCYENLRFFCILNNLTEKILHKRINYIQEKLDLKEIMAKRFDQCSTGMKRRLAIARALISRPKLLILDEPTNSLDFRSIDRVMEILNKQVQDFGMSIIYITHNTDETRFLSGRLAKMDKGKFSFLES